MTERRRRQQRYVYTATADELIREMNSKPRILSKETRHKPGKSKAYEHRVCFISCGCVIFMRHGTYKLHPVAGGINC